MDFISALSEKYEIQYLSLLGAKSDSQIYLERRAVNQNPFILGEY